MTAGPLINPGGRGPKHNHNVVAGHLGLSLVCQRYSSAMMSRPVSVLPLQDDPAPCHAYDSPGHVFIVAGALLSKRKASILTCLEGPHLCYSFDLVASPCRCSWPSRLSVSFCPDNTGTMLQAWISGTGTIPEHTVVLCKSKVH